MADMFTLNIEVYLQIATCTFHEKQVVCYETYIIEISCHIK